MGYTAIQVNLMGVKLYFFLWNELQCVVGFYDEWQNIFINPWMIVLADHHSKSIYGIGMYAGQDKLMPLQNYRGSLSSICYRKLLISLKWCNVRSKAFATEVVHWILYCGGKVEPLWTSVSGMMVPLYMDPLSKHWSIWGRMLPDIHCINYLPIWFESLLNCGCLSLSILLGIQTPSCFMPILGINTLI